MNQTTYEIGFPVNTLSPSEQFDYSALSQPAAKALQQHAQSILGSVDKARRTT